MKSRYLIPEKKLMPVAHEVRVGVLVRNQRSQMLAKADKKSSTLGMEAKV